MPAEQAYLAVDLGASGGRHVAGLFDGSRLTLRDIHRFENGPVTLGDQMIWDLPRLWQEIQHGLRAATVELDAPLVSVGVDTWGVDFGLLGRGDVLLGNPSHYRDPRNRGMCERAFEIVPAEIFSATGLQFIEINSLYQLLAMKLADSPLLESAESMLMMPDLFHWLLSGEKANEVTDASTSQLYDPQTGTWSSDLIERFQLPPQIFGPLVPPGTRLGPLRKTLADELSLSGLQVVLPGTHDTASAVLAVPAASPPAAQPDWCYISSGTWSLMGVEVPRPVVNDQCLRLNFTNEAGVGGTTRLLKNITGLWLVQECRRIWKQSGREYSWEELARAAGDAPPLVSVINPDDPRLVAPADMPRVLRELAAEAGQPVPETDGAVIRTALESLALKYRQVLSWLEELTGGPIGTVHIVGGGTQNRLLCQMTADACGRPVVAGPVEATAIGNVAMQAVSSGAIGGVAEARQIVRASFPVEQYEPRDTEAWDAAYATFERLSPPPSAT